MRNGCEWKKSDKDEAEDVAFVIGTRENGREKDSRKKRYPEKRRVSVP